MDRLRREAVAEHEATTRAGGSSSFDPLRPWNTAWQKATNHEAFWREEVIEPGMLILTKVVGLNDMVEGDATIKGAAASSHPRETQPAPAWMASNQRQPLRQLPERDQGSRTDLEECIRSKMGNTRWTERVSNCVKGIRTGNVRRQPLAYGAHSNGTRSIDATDASAIIRASLVLTKTCKSQDSSRGTKARALQRGRKGARELPTDKRMMSERLSRPLRGGVCMTTLTTTESSKMRWQYRMLACRIQPNVNLQSWNLWWIELEVRWAKQYSFMYYISLVGRNVAKTGFRSFAVILEWSTRVWT